MDARLPLPDISIRQLEYLVAVADHRTWAAAAESTGVSPSALSQGLAELERRVGVTLFDRDGRQRRLRPGARPVLEHARQVLALTGDLSAWAASIRDGARGRVRLGMIDAAALSHFPDVLRSFRAGRPELLLHLAVEPSAVLLDALTRGELDLVVCVRPPDLVPGVEVTHLLAEELAVCAPSGVAATADATTWGPWVLFPEGSHTRATIGAALARAGATVDVVAESHQPEVLRAMVRLGVGWTVLPVGQLDDGADLVRVGSPLTTRDLVLARREGTVVDPAARDLADALLRASAARPPVAVGEHAGSGGIR